MEEPSCCRQPTGSWKWSGGWLAVSTITGTPGRTEHGLEALLRQRVFGIGMGYEDLNDHDEIRRDSVLALACGRNDLTGHKRARARDRAYPLAGSSTLNRLELGTPGSAESHRYKKIVADPERLDALLVDLFLDMHPEPPEEIVLDLDVTGDQVHGNQEGGPVPRLLRSRLLSASPHHLRRPSARHTASPVEDRRRGGCARGVGAGGRADPGALAGSGDHRSG